MNPKLAEKFITSNSNKVLRLFSLYQIVEIMLFMRLYEGTIMNPDDPDEFGKFSKIFQYKTFGKLIKEYSKKYPKDELNLLSQFNEVLPQRNNFMHSMWVMVALSSDQEEANYNGNMLITKYDKSLTKLFHDLTDAKFQKL